MNHHGNAEPKIGSAPTQTPNLDPVSTSEFTAKYESLLARGDGPEMEIPYNDKTTFSKYREWKDPDEWVNNQWNGTEINGNQWKEGLDLPIADFLDQLPAASHNVLPSSDSEPERRSRYSLKQKFGAAFLVAATAASAFGIFKANDHDEVPRSQPIATATATPEASAPAPATAPDMISSRLLEQHPLGGSVDMSAISGRLTAAEKEAAKTAPRENGHEVVPLSTIKLSHDGKLYGASSSLALGEQDGLTLYNATYRNQTLLTYLLKSGKINEVRFSVATDPTSMEEQGDGDMRISPPAISKSGVEIPGYIAYVLPPKGEVTAQAMGVMIGHEGAHLTQRNIDVVDKLSDTDEKKERVDGNFDADNSTYEKLCQDMRDSSLGAAQRDPAVIEAAQQVLDLTAGGGNSRVLKQAEVARAILNGTFADMQPTVQAPNLSVGPDYVVDECRVARPTRFVYPFRDKSYDSLTQEQSDALYALEIAVDEAMYRSTSLGVFKESNYLHTSESVGHPELTPELLASAYNIMKNYPEQFVKNVLALPLAEQQSTILLANTIMLDTIRANKDNPNAIALVHEDQLTLDWINAELAAMQDARKLTPTQ